MKLLLRLVNNLLLVYLLYMVCRVVYVGEFWDLYSAGWSQLSIGNLLKGGLRFDTSAILYTNMLYMALVLLPLPKRWVCTRGYQLGIKWVYVVVNAFMLSLNLVDTVYSRYTGRRTTWTFFSEFGNEGNLGNIVGIELLRHWYLVLIGIGFILALVYLYRMPRQPIAPATGRKVIIGSHDSRRPRYTTAEFIFQTVCLLVAIPLTIIGMRGGASTAIRPITISNANQYVNRPAEAAIVLNTPFSLIRTMGKTTFVDPGYFSAEELDLLYSPLHLPSDVEVSASDTVQQPFSHFSNRNVVVLILESFGMEHIGAYNGGQGYTPFLDSLIAHSFTFRHSYANGRKSIDAMPSILSGIPMFVEPFFVTSYSLNRVSGLAGELGQEGYTTAFFHGAENGSMGFQAFARTTGFQQYYGRTEYNRWKESNYPGSSGEEDFDGTWAIWDEEFLQFYASTLEQMAQPFMTALFTATSHHPFVVPKRYRQSLHEEGHPICTCIRYTDMALRRFFEVASRMPWFDSTIFVLTADHTNVNLRPEYNTPLGTFSVPIIFYDPSGQLPTGVSQAIAQQTDIMPTMLGLLGYRQPYLAYGVDLLHTPDSLTWAIHYSGGIYQHVQEGYLLLYDGQHPTAYYNLDVDPYQQNNLLQNGGMNDSSSSALRRHLRHAQAIIQSYMQRMTTNRLIP